MEKVFLIYDCIKCKFKQEKSMTNPLKEHNFVICYESPVLTGGFINKLPNSFEERNKLSVENVRDLFEVFKENHFVAFGKLHNIKDLNKLNPTTAPTPKPTPKAEPQVQEEKKPVEKPQPAPTRKVESFLEKDTGNSVFHDFTKSSSPKKHFLQDYEMSITKNKTSYRISFGAGIRNEVKNGGLERMLVREDETIGTLHFVFNAEKGVSVNDKNNGSTSYIANKQLTEFLFDKFHIDEEHRSEGHIITLSQNLSHTSQFITYKLLSIKKK